MASVQTTEGRPSLSGLDPAVKAKVAIVTGASRGIGLGITERLLETGYCIVGVVNTPMHKVEAHDFLKQLSPFNRLAEISEVVDLVQFLESAPFVNGEVIHLDGGAHAGKW
jgi:NAD(P)-dependent dehydrogenase (short-subunit alcohol dehydrogenase family)